jgi:uncharacterized protein (TIGR02246 family)
MTNTHPLSLACSVIALLLAVPCLLNGQPTSQSADEAAVRASAAAFTKAFNLGDATALADLWTEHGENINHTGYMIRGRKAIAEAFAKLFSKHQGISIDITIQSISFPQDGVAVEIGTTKTLTPESKTPVDGSYTAIHVKEDDHWWRLRVVENPPMPPSNYEHLKSLEWLVGTWIDDVEGQDKQKASETPVVHTTCRWSINRNFLIRNFTTTVNNKVTGTGTQHIGWYAPTQQVRSWTFDSNGHIVASIWTPSGDEWTVKNNEALPSGETTSSTEMLSRKGDDTQIWRTVHYTPDGKPVLQPDVVVKRYRDQGPQVP